MTKRDTLTSPVPPDDCRPMMGDPLDPIRQICNEIDASVAAELAKLERPRHRGIIAAEFYVDSARYPCDRDPWVDVPPGWTPADETPEPRRVPWQALLAIVLLIALVAFGVLRGMEWWQAMTVGVVMSAGASIAWGGLVAEAGRDAGVVR